MTAPEEFVRYEVHDRIALMEMNRPTRHNAIGQAMIGELQQAFATFDEDDAADVAILAGAGPSFSSGADVKEAQMGTREELEKSRDPMGIGHPFAELLHRCRNWKPVIAATHGNTLGMALGLALDCDFIVAEDGTRFQVTETPRGLGGFRHWALMRARGLTAPADEVCATGRPFFADEAHRWGMVVRLAEKGALRDTAYALARELAANPPLSVRETIRIRRWHVSRLTREIAFQAEPSRLHLTEDFAEAVRAFTEKRLPAAFKAR